MNECKDKQFISPHPAPKINNSTQLLGLTYIFMVPFGPRLVLKTSWSPFAALMFIWRACAALATSALGFTTFIAAMVFSLTDEPLSSFLAEASRLFHRSLQLETCATIDLVFTKNAPPQCTTNYSAHFLSYSSLIFNWNFASSNRAQ